MDDQQTCDIAFDAWYAAQRHQLSNEPVCRAIWRRAWGEQSKRGPALAATVDMLRNALVGIIGVRDPDQLRGMEAFLRSQHAPDQYKTAAINAIHALLATKPEHAIAAEGGES